VLPPPFYEGEWGEANEGGWTSGVSRLVLCSRLGLTRVTEKAAGGGATVTRAVAGSRGASSECGWCEWW